MNDAPPKRSASTNESILGVPLSGAHESAWAALDDASLEQWAAMSIADLPESVREQALRELYRRKAAAFVWEPAIFISGDDDKGRRYQSKVLQDERAI